jgi:hypothetical protein
MAETGWEAHVEAQSANLVFLNDLEAHRLAARYIGSIVGELPC